MRYSQSGDSSELAARLPCKGKRGEKPWCLPDNALPSDTPQLAAGRLHFERTECALQRFFLGMRGGVFHLGKGARARGGNAPAPVRFPGWYLLLPHRLRHLRRNVPATGARGIGIASIASSEGQCLRHRSLASGRNPICQEELLCLGRPAPGLPVPEAPQAWGDKGNSC